MSVGKTIVEALKAGLAFNKDVVSLRNASGAPAIFNAKPDNTRNLRRIVIDAQTGVASGKIGFVGDSTTAGHGSSGGPFYGDRRKSYPHILAARLAARGVPAHANTAFGCSNVATILGTGALTMQLFDPRITFGTGWGFGYTGFANFSSIGGKMFGAQSTASGNLSFDFGSAVWDQVDIWYLRNSTAGAFPVDRGGVAPSSGSPINANNGSNALGKTTLTWAAAASGVLNLGPPATNNIAVIGVVVRNTASPAIEIYNLGIGASTSAAWQTGSTYYGITAALAALAPDVTFLGLGVNDWNATADPAAFKTNTQSQITAAKVSGDPILLFSMQSNPSVYASVATQQAYLAALKDLAITNDCPLIDVQTLFGGWSTANTRGYMADDRHGSVRGYAVEGNGVDHMLQLVGC